MTFGEYFPHLLTANEFDIVFGIPGVHCGDVPVTLPNQYMREILPMISLFPVNGLMLLPDMEL